jgi:hypothetical protein
MELALSCKFPVLASIFGLPIVIRFVPIGDEAHRLTLIQKNSILVEVYWEILYSFYGRKVSDILRWMLSFLYNWFSKKYKNV